MDAKKFGEFIAENRKQKGMTQTELAQKIYVTDKAVSRWERGKGFPDIHTIEPLADALGLTVLEIMQSKKLEDKNNYNDISKIMKSVIEIEKENKRQERTAIGLAIFTIIIIAILFYQINRANLGGSVFFGTIVAVEEVAIYYFLDNREDKESRKINIIIAAITLFIIIFILFI